MLNHAYNNVLFLARKLTLSKCAVDFCLPSSLMLGGTSNTSKRWNMLLQSHLQYLEALGSGGKRIPGCVFELAIKIVYLFLQAAHQQHLHITALVASVTLLGHILFSALLSL